ncbi:hypothetical protein GVN24_03875 [Rhizobium sp. CRIBSB]|nr:hypothetical protein [Rhizobium sp. CRIBSB]
MSKTNPERIEGLLGEIHQRISDMTIYVENLRDRPGEPDLQRSLAGLRLTVVEAQASIRVVGTVNLEGLWAATRLVANAVGSVGSDTPVTVQGMRFNAPSLLRQDLSSIENRLRGIQIGLNKMSLDQLRDSIPEQKVAAFQFAYEGERLVLVSQVPSESDPDLVLAKASLRALLQQGERVAAELKRSNCHPRLVDAFEALQATLNAHDNVVEIGILSRSCMSITLASADELAATLFELINAHLHGVDDFLAQHQDWRKFVENALHAKLGPNEVSQLIETARGIAAAVSDEAKVDPSVPAAIQHIALLAEEIREPDGKVAFALSRTLENFIAITVRALLGVKNDVVSEVRKLNARLIISALVALPITVFGYVNGAEWVPAAVTQALKGVLP